LRAICSFKKALKSKKKRISGAVQDVFEDVLVNATLLKTTKAQENAENAENADDVTPGYEWQGGETCDIENGRTPSCIDGGSTVYDGSVKECILADFWGSYSWDDAFPCSDYSSFEMARRIGGGNNCYSTLASNPI